jgi:SAM-dependent methyltransferase
MEITPAKRGSRSLFIVTILMGSFLLFLVQPMVARMALPRLGGAPSVWNSAMLVYQALLLGGYAYAHWLSRLAPKRQAMIHIGLFVIAALWLPLGLAKLELPANTSPIFWMPWLLVASIGPLFFAVAAQAPLMQRWYNLAGNEGEPYALYAASNIGSFGGLIAYPLLVEPMMPLRAQNWLWSAIYILLGLMVAICAKTLWNKNEAQTSAQTGATPPASISWKKRLYWIILAAVPSGLMLSTTTHLTTDLVAMPLIWVMPLGLYLISFTIAFADTRTVASAMTFTAPVVVLLCAAFTFLRLESAVIGMLLLNLSLLFFVAVALHSEMYRTRPEPAQLTQFYLMMSLGGVIGGFFCAIVAPLIFDWTWEHPLLIILAAILLPQKRLLSFGSDGYLDPRVFTLITIALGLIAAAIGIYGGMTMPLDMDLTKQIMAACMICIGFIITGNRFAYVITVAALLYANGGSYNISVTAADARQRSYFGIYTINTDGASRWLMHGTTMHGMQMFATPKKPISYYGPASGVGQAMTKAESLYGNAASIGVVGLGTGTLSCYAKPDQKWQFFEIDPLMISIARDQGIFSFLDKCAPNAKIILGDARLTVAKTKPQSFDILAIDAFSSDSIPLHLLTKQAFAIYGRSLKPDGTLLVHISNRYIDLNSVVAAEAKQGGWKAALRHDNSPQKALDAGERPSLWIALNRDGAKLAQLTGVLSKTKTKHYNPEQWLSLDSPADDIWTDDYASVLPHLSVWKTRK